MRYGKELGSSESRPNSTAGCCGRQESGATESGLCEGTPATAGKARGGQRLLQASARPVVVSAATAKQQHEHNYHYDQGCITHCLFFAFPIVPEHIRTRSRPVYCAQRFHYLALSGGR